MIHGIWFCRSLHKDKVFLPSQGRTLTHASILVKSLARSCVAGIVIELGGICENPLYAKLGIMVIHLWKPSLGLLRHCNYQPHEDYGDLPSYNTYKTTTP